MQNNTTEWLGIAAAIAVIGGWIRYYYENRHRHMGLAWWIGCLVDAISSIFISTVVFFLIYGALGAYGVAVEYAQAIAAGLGGYAGHLGTREVVFLITKLIESRKKR
jgi:hypothetical protein